MGISSHSSSRLSQAPTQHKPAHRTPLHPHSWGPGVISLPISVPSSVEWKHKDLPCGGGEGGRTTLGLARSTGTFPALL